MSSPCLADAGIVSDRLEVEGYYCLKLLIIEKNKPTLNVLSDLYSNEPGANIISNT